MQLAAGVHAMGGREAETEDRRPAIGGLPVQLCVQLGAGAYEVLDDLTGFPAALDRIIGLALEQQSTSQAKQGFSGADGSSEVV